MLCVSLPWIQSLEFVGEQEGQEPEDAAEGHDQPGAGQLGPGGVHDSAQPMRAAFYVSVPRTYSMSAQFFSSLPASLLPDLPCLSFLHQLAFTTGTWAQLLITTLLPTQHPERLSYDESRADRLVANKGMHKAYLNWEITQVCPMISWLGIFIFTFYLHSTK